MRDAEIITMGQELQRQFNALAKQTTHNTLLLSTQLEHMNNRIAAIQDVLFSRFSIFVGVLGLFWPGGVHLVLAWREEVIAKDMAAYAEKVKERRDREQKKKENKIPVFKPHETNGLVRA